MLEEQIEFVHLTENFENFEAAFGLSFKLKVNQYFQL